MPEIKLPELTIVSGDESARKFLEEGASIADFLIDPLRPCVVRNGMDAVIALNKGSVEASFFSCFWEQQLSAVADVYVVEYMADEAVVLSLPCGYVRPPRNPEEFLEQRGACELSYSGSASDIRRALVSHGFAVHDKKTSPSKWEELEAQRIANLSQMPDIANFYLGE